MHSVINVETSILVTRVENNFEVQFLATGAVVFIEAKQFYGNSYKYESDFIRKFKNAFNDKNIQNIFLSYEASNFMNDLICFNRVDN